MAFATSRMFGFTDSLKGTSTISPFSLNRAFSRSLNSLLLFSSLYDFFSKKAKLAGFHRKPSEICMFSANPPRCALIETIRRLLSKSDALLLPASTPVNAEKNVIQISDQMNQLRIPKYCIQGSFILNWLTPHFFNTSVYFCWLKTVIRMMF